MISPFLRASVISGLFVLGACHAPSEPPATKPASVSMASAPESRIAPSGIAALPPPSVQMNGRTAIVSLPVRLSANLIWVSATRMADADPFVFKGLEIKPSQGPQGTDLAVFTYEAEHAGAAILKFGLVPPGKTLIGLPGAVYSGPVATRYEVRVAAQ